MAISAGFDPDSGLSARLTIDHGAGNDIVTSSPGRGAALLGADDDPFVWDHAGEIQSA